MTVPLEVKAEFLYNVFQDWSDGTDYQDEPIHTVLKNADAGYAVCLLLAIEVIDLAWSSDFEWIINGTYDKVMSTLEERQKAKE